MMVRVFPDALDVTSSLLFPSSFVMGGIEDDEVMTLVTEFASVVNFSVNLVLP